MKFWLEAKELGHDLMKYMHIDDDPDYWVKYLDGYFLEREALLIAPLPFWY